MEFPLALLIKLVLQKNIKATMAAYDVLKQQLIMNHNELIQQLETKYIGFISGLLEKKKNILLNIQQQFYKRMQYIDTIKLFENNEIYQQNKQNESLLSMLLNPNINTNDIIDIMQNIKYDDIDEPLYQQTTVIEQ